MIGNNRTFVRKKIVVVFFVCTLALIGLFGRLVFLMVWKSDYYSHLATMLHERERSIKAARGQIVDRNGVVIADNRTVCTVSVIHNQIEDAETVIRLLVKELGVSEEFARARVEKYSSIERIKSNVDKEVGDRIREADLPGVKVDEDYKRYYPYDELASKVLGFTGSDNQGIIGLEVIYEKYLSGQPGTILTVTDARGIEVDAAGESRIEPIDGNILQISMDMNIQSYATQLANQALETKEAESVSIIVMNPQTGEILAMVNAPEFNLNDPYTVPVAVKTDESINGEMARGEVQTASLTGEALQNALNKMWRNGCINDTYEPGSTFKVMTAAAALESTVVTKESTFHCPGYVLVEGRRIRCHKTNGHGAEDFVKATMNSCNPVFVTLGLRMGVDTFYHYFEQFGLLKKTGIDLPGEAGTIMHKKENIKDVELATMSFGQSFQISPIQLLTTISSVINGGNRVTPHFGTVIKDQQGRVVETLEYPVTEGILSAEVSAQMREILELVVAEGGGKNAKIEGVAIGGKTATSETLPRGRGVYISSFVGFAPADNPQVIALAIINHPKGQYYGGVIAAPVVRQLFENILPYLEIMDYNEG